MPARIHCIISGSVHGVSFRWHTKEKATQLGLGGWVRNNKDGTVECVAEGEKSRLEEFGAWYKHGPQFAHVTSCTVTWEKWKGEFSLFSILY